MFVVVVIEQHADGGRAGVAAPGFETLAGTLPAIVGQFARRPPARASDARRVSHAQISGESYAKAHAHQRRRSAPQGSCLRSSGWATGSINAMMESFWSSMQIELLNRKKWNTRVELANAIFERDQATSWPPKLESIPWGRSRCHLSV